ARFRLAPGPHLLTALRDGTQLFATELNLRAQESMELIATVYPDAAPSLLVERSHGTPAAAAQAAAPGDAGPPGELEGRVLGSEDGQPVANARVYVAGTPLDLVTDAEGRFRAELPAGEHALSVIAPGFSTQTLSAIPVEAGQTLLREIRLTPAGLELPEF